VIVGGFAIDAGFAIVGEFVIVGRFVKGVAGFANSVDSFGKAVAGFENSVAEFVTVAGSVSGFAKAAGFANFASAQPVI